MKSKTFGTILAISSLLSLLWSGCSNDSKITSYVKPPGLVLSISPADGSTSVPTGTAVTLVFSSSVDRNAFEESFLVLHGQMMHLFMDSLSAMHSGSDSLNMMMTFQGYGWDGHFQWNDQNDTCVFHPDSSLAPNTEYMVYIMRHREQHQHMHQHNGQTFDYDFQSHFQTGGL